LPVVDLSSGVRAVCVDNDVLVVGIRTCIHDLLSGKGPDSPVAERIDQSSVTVLEGEESVNHYLYYVQLPSVIKAYVVQIIHIDLREGVDGELLDGQS
jgi:hypothetical protein